MRWSLSIPKRKAQSSPLNFKRWHACDMTHTWENSKKLGFLKSGSTGAAKKTPARCFFPFSTLSLPPGSRFFIPFENNDNSDNISSKTLKSINRTVSSLKSVSPFPLSVSTSLQLQQRKSRSRFFSAEGFPLI